MNKIYRYTGLALLMGFSLLATLPSCKQDSPAEETSQMMSFRLLSSDHSFMPGGGTGKLQLSEGGFTLKTDADWIQLGAVDGMEATFTVKPLTSVEARTAKILISKEGKTIELAVTQLGAYDYLIDAKSSYEMDRNGGEILLPYLSHTGSTPTVEGLPSWITSTVEAGQIKLQVASLAGPDRSASFVVKIGSLSETTIAVKQAYGELAYEQLLGEYTISGLANGATDVAKVTSYPVKLIEKDKSKNLFTLQGLAYDIEVGYDPATSTLTLHYLNTRLQDGTPLFMTLWGCGLPNKAGQPNWDLKSDEGRQLRATWDRQSPEHASFAFKSPKLKDEDEDYAGFLFWKGKNDGTFSQHYRWGEAGVVSSLGNIQLVKK